MFLCLVAVFLILTAKADEPYYADYDWEYPFVVPDLSEDYLAEPELIVKDHLSYEYVYGFGGLNRYLLRHQITRVNSDEAIARNNRLYLPINSAEDLFIQKARVIKPDGSEIVLKEEDILQAEDEESGRVFNYFALEGLVKGCYIEYIYLIKTNPVLAGSRITFQGETPKVEVSIELMSPENLIIASKSYNGFPDLMVDDSYEERFVIEATAKDIPAVYEEPYALMGPNLQQIVFKFSQNTELGISNMFSYRDAADHWVENTFVEKSKYAKKELKNLMKAIKIPGGGDYEKIRAVEDYIKMEYQVLDMNVAELGELDYILENKMGNEGGMLELYASVFDEMGLDYEVVFTCNRYDYSFDKEFEGYNYIDEDLLYFPKADVFLIPADVTHRVGLVPAYYSNNGALFIRKDGSPEKGWDVKTRKATIPADPYWLSCDTLILNAVLSEDMSQAAFNVSQSMTGHNAATIQVLTDFLTEEEASTLLESMVKNLNANQELDHFEYENVGAESTGRKPLRMNSEFSSSNYINKAGSKYLFKIGELIGPQVEMYQEGERQFDIDTDFNHLYHRVLTIEAPEGFVFKNLDDLVMDFSDEEETMLFKSDYTLNGNSLEVKVTEYYGELHYPIEMFETFRSVINAAADFNKITIVVEPEG